MQSFLRTLKGRSGASARAARVLVRITAALVSEFRTAQEREALALDFDSAAE
jgi:hypothetical protein